jgi:hypothetical protein
LEQNLVFLNLRGKLVAFFRKLEAYRQGDNKVFNFPDDTGPTKEQLDSLKLKTTLMRSLKKLLHMAILTDDKALQMNQLGRIYAWFNQRENSQLSKEAIFAAKQKQELMLKKQ